MRVCQFRCQLTFGWMWGGVQSEAMHALVSFWFSEAPRWGGVNGLLSIL